MEQPITNTTPVEAPASEAEATTLVKLSKPYKFEGRPTRRSTCPAWTASPQRI